MVCGRLDVVIKVGGVAFPHSERQGCTLNSNSIFTSTRRFRCTVTSAGGVRGNAATYNLRNKCGADSSLEHITDRDSSYV